MFSNSGTLGLPFVDVHAWDAITIQVQARAREILNHDCKALLVGVEGTPSLKGVTFLYSATAKDTAPVEDQLWVDPKDAASLRLTANDLRLLHLFRSNLGGL